MRKSIFCCVIFFLALAVFMASGCGGSLDPEDENPPATDNTTEREDPIPNDNPSKHDVSRVLLGTWVNNDPSVTAAPDNYLYSMRLVSADMTFVSIDMGQNTGTAYLTSNQTWKVLTGSQIELDRTISLDEQPIEIKHQGNDRWQILCGSDEDTYTKIDITITSESLISAIYESYITIDMNSEPHHFIVEEINFTRKDD